MRIARRALLACTLPAFLLASGCAHHKTARVPAPPSPLARAGTTETGIASWYGVPYDGRRAASGEIYDMEQLTAAHRTLPFQTWVSVTNLANGKQVDVRIIDRGPFVDGRVIDLSLAAARAIDMVRSGTARVRLTVIAPPEGPVSSGEASPTPGGYAVQAGAFSDQARAEALRKSLRLPDTRLIQRGDPPLWHVLVGHGLTMESAAALASRVEKSVGEAIVVIEQ